MKRRNVVSISEYDGWHQLAEMQRDPKPSFTPSKHDPLNFLVATCCFAAVIATGWMLLEWLL